MHKVLQNENVLWRFTQQKIGVEIEKKFLKGKLLNNNTLGLEAFNSFHSYKYN